jgi:hypothetical protein
MKLIITMVLFFKLGPFKTTISQPMENANFIDPSRLRDSGFERISFFTLLKRKL